MPVNWSGSRPNLNRHQTSPSVRDFSELTSPFVQYPSLASLSASPRNEPSSVIKRRIVVNQKHKPPLVDARGHLLQSFTSNQITTSKYTVFTFIPKNLYEQFRGIANFYFLSLVILQAFDYFKEVSVAVTAAPLIFIVLVTGVKVCPVSFVVLMNFGNLKSPSRMPLKILEDTSRTTM
jgi:phospholipid-translocating ATPase